MSRKLNKEASRKLNKNNFETKQVENLIKITLNSILQVSLGNRIVIKGTIPSTIDNLQGTNILS